MGAHLLLQILQLQLDVRNATGSNGTVTLTNTQRWPRNNSGATIALPFQRDTTNYTVTVEVVSATGGGAGNVWITNKLRNGFQLRYDGSATSVVIRWNVTGGMA
jgi:hypothetical protein